MWLTSAYTYVKIFLRKANDVTWQPQFNLEVGLRYSVIGDELVWDTSTLMIMHLTLYILNYVENE